MFGAISENVGNTVLIPSQNLFIDFFLMRFKLTTLLVSVTYSLELSEGFSVDYLSQSGPWPQDSL